MKRALTQPKPEKLSIFNYMAAYFLYEEGNGIVYRGERFYPTRAEAEREAKRHPKKPKVGRLVLTGIFTQKAGRSTFKARTWVDADDLTKAEYRQTEEYRRRRQG